MDAGRQDQRELPARVGDGPRDDTPVEIAGVDRITSERNRFGTTATAWILSGRPQNLTSHDTGTRRTRYRPTGHRLLGHRQIR
jgi:YD repeat-containing protein